MLRPMSDYVLGRASARRILNIHGSVLVSAYTTPRGVRYVEVPSNGARPISLHRVIYRIRVRLK